VKSRDEIIARILQREGGVADVGDGKGVTRYGQTPGWLSQFNLPIPTNETEAAENYAAWMRLTKLDQLLSDRTDTLADAVIDLAVHSGHVVAIKALQGALGVTADGVIGPVTLKAVRIDEDRRRAAAGVIAWRVIQQGNLIAQNPGKYARYAHGWARRNAEHIRGLA
jgi:lysozyme family protein